MSAIATVGSGKMKTIADEETKIRSLLALSIRLRNCTDPDRFPECVDRYNKHILRLQLELVKFDKRSQNYYGA